MASGINGKYIIKCNPLPIAQLWGIHENDIRHGVIGGTISAGIFEIRGVAIIFQNKFQNFHNIKKYLFLLLMAAKV